MGNSKACLGLIEFDLRHFPRIMTVDIGADENRDDVDHDGIRDI
jgi:hypothetical protein